LSPNCAHVLVVAAVFALPGVGGPEHALATVHSPQYVGETGNSRAGSAFAADLQFDGQLSTDAAWTTPALDDATEFTEIAMAYDPNPVRQLGEANLPSEEAALSLNEPPSRAKVSEPATLVLFGTALLGVASAMRKKSKR